MAKLVMSTDPQIPIFFNLSQPVGKGGANLPEDVALATYLMKAAAPAAGPKIEADFRERHGNQPKFTGAYTEDHRC